jgi:YHS domain-containing protein
MNVKPNTPHRLTHDGAEVLFCSAGCKTKFAADPATYIKAAASCCSAQGEGHNHHVATPVVLWAGWPFFVRGVKSVVNRSLNMFTLIGLGVGSGYLFSWLRSSFRGCSRMASATRRGMWASISRPARSSSSWSCSGQVMELGARERTGSAIRALLDLAAKTARVIRADGREEEIPLDGSRRRRPAGAPGRQGAGGWHRARRSLVDRRVDDLGRAGTGGEGRRRRGHRGDDQRHRLA